MVEVIVDKISSEMVETFSLVAGKGVDFVSSRVIVVKSVTVDVESPLLVLKTV